MTESNVWDAESLLEIGRRFQQSRVFLSGVELDLFTLLADASMSASEVAGARKCDTRGMTVLLDALCAMELLQKEGDKYTTRPDVVRRLSSKGDESILPMALHSAGVWERWSQLTEIVRTGKPAHRPVVQDDGGDSFRAFILAMHVAGRGRADGIVGRIDLKGVKRIIDIGGASGTYTLAFLKTSPDVVVTLFDLPQAISLAKERLSREGVLNRVNLCPGDFYENDLPGEHDLAFLSAIIHQNSRKQNRALYRKTFAALVPGGRIVIRDHVMDPSRIKPASGALFAINMLVATDGGGTYTFEEIQEDLNSAGFSKVALMQPDKMMDGLVEAHK